MSKHRSYCFTLNNYTDADITHLDNVKCRYMVYGKEVGENGTPHLQGTVYFESPITFRNAKNKLSLDGRIHIESTKDFLKSVEYCKKDGIVTERGIIPSQGKRNDIEDFKNWVKLGVGVNMANARELFSEVSAKYPQFVDFYIADSRPKPQITLYPLRLWQANLNTYLNLPPVNREVVFIVDYIGNTGKSWFATYYERNHENVQIIAPCKKVDMSYMLVETSRVIFIDCPRSSKEHLSYTLMEELKNGRVTSSKYQSRVKLFNTCHVIVLMNDMPDMDKLSRDRYNIIEVTAHNNSHIADEESS